MKTQAQISSDEFSGRMATLFPGSCSVRSIAVAVSGGADSLALTLLLADWAATRQIKIHALSVDHGLRVESREEAVQVKKWLGPYKNVTHETLVWRGAKPKTKISEVARAKRYDLLVKYCHKNNIRHLFLGHHLNDQAETFLLRLAHGSGLDGLAGMLPVQNRDEIEIVRPLLSISHDRLIATLKARKQKWIEDPTNQKTDYARPRLRAAEKVLMKEGLSPQRLAQTAARIARGRAALEYLTDQAWGMITRDKKGVTILNGAWDSWPDDLRVRILTRALTHINGKNPPARMEQIERVVERLVKHILKTIRMTIGGCLVARGQKTIKITREIGKK